MGHELKIIWQGVGTLKEIVFECSCGHRVGRILLEYSEFVRIEWAAAFGMAFAHHAMEMVAREAHTRAAINAGEDRLAKREGEPS